MTALVAWGAQAIVASTLLMLAVLLVRSPLRRAIGPRLAYALWALPALRMVMPPLPVAPATGIAESTGTVATIIATGMAAVPASLSVPTTGSLSAMLATLWAVGAIVTFATFAIRHAHFRRRVLAGAAPFDRVGTIRIVSANVEGPVAFGVVRRFVAVPRDFESAYDQQERRLALAHECAHHARGDLVANWIVLVVLALHWWNPVAWAAHAAFRDDQEFAADAHVLAAVPGGLRSYAMLLAKAAGVGAPPACSLNARATLKGRLMMLNRTRRPLRQVALAGTFAFLLGGAALAATAVTPDKTGASGAQAVTIGVKPDGAGGWSLIVAGVAVAPGAPLPGGQHLPADFSRAGGCDLGAEAKPLAMAIKGGQAAGTPTETYTVMCASAAPAPIGATLAEGLASLRAMRASVASQPASAAFPEAERTHALAAIDRSIRDVATAIARQG